MEEIAKIGQENIAKQKAEMNILNETIQQVHDELEDHTAKQQKFRDFTIKDMKRQKEHNSASSALLEQWRNDLNQIALIQSCTSEFIQMQTALDSHAYAKRADFTARINEKVNRLAM